MHQYSHRSLALTVGVTVPAGHHDHWHAYGHGGPPGWQVVSYRESDTVVTRTLTCARFLQFKHTYTFTIIPPGPGPGPVLWGPGGCPCTVCYILQIKYLWKYKLLLKETSLVQVKMSKNIYINNSICSRIRDFVMINMNNLAIDALSRPHVMNAVNCIK